MTGTTRTVYHFEMSTDYR